MGIFIRPADNNYLCIGRNYYEVIYEKRDNMGEQIIREKLYNNTSSDKHCLDAAFINDKEYLLLFNEGNYDFGYYPPNVSVVLKRI